MNPLTNMKNQQKLNERELSLGLTGTSSSWHREYDDSAWVYVGGLPYDLTEGDVICIFSQYGEIVNINLVRDKDTGKSKGFAFICYEDQRSTILAVDNLNGAKILNRALRVDHKHDYQVPKERADEDDLTKQLREQGCAPSLLPETASDERETEKKKKKKEKKKKKKKDVIQSHSPSRSSSLAQQASLHNRDASPLVRMKTEFPDDTGNFGSSDRKRGGTYLTGDEDDVRVTEEIDRRKVNSSDSPYQRRRRHSPQRLGNDCDVRRDSSRSLAVDGSRSMSHTEKSSLREPNREGRSGTGRSQVYRYDSKSSSKNRVEEISRQHDQRESQEQRRHRSSSSSGSDEHRRTRVVEPKRSHQHQMPDRRDGRQKRHRRSSSSGDDDRNQVRNGQSRRVVDGERYGQWNQSPDSERRKDRSSRPHR